MIDSVQESEGNLGVLVETCYRQKLFGTMDETFADYMDWTISTSSGNTVYGFPSGETAPAFDAQTVQLGECVQGWLSFQLSADDPPQTLVFDYWEMSQVSTSWPIR